MYRSTRGSDLVHASKAIINGLSADGGLYIPEEIPQLDLHEMRNFTYRQLTSYILSKFLDDFSVEEINDIVSFGYKNFSALSVVDIKKTKECYFLELFYGPTLAFKDIALTLLPFLIKASKQKQHLDLKTLILCATSGDTGSAALSAFKDQDNVSMAVIYPIQGVSFIQEKQMLKNASTNKFVVGLNGDFDQAQREVKKAFNDLEIKKHLRQYHLASANSINIARVIPQIVYYIYAYLELVRRNEIKCGEQVNFSIPTGNFGNILACFMAKKMGLPIKKLICASNINNVLTDFFTTGIYNTNRKLIKTISPSIDILNASNLERLLFYLVEDHRKVKQMMDQLVQTKKFHLEDAFKAKLNDFLAYDCNEEETLTSIKSLFIQEQYLIDPHTAVGYHAYKKYQLQNDTTKTIVVATAHPYKFPKTILKALNEEYQNDEFVNLKQLEAITNVKIPSSLTDLDNINYPSQSIDDILSFLKEKVKL